MPLATPNSWKVAVVSGCSVGLCLGLVAQPKDPPAWAAEGPRDFALEAQRAYTNAQERYRQEPDKVEAAWQFGRACFDWADLATTSDQRADVAEQGIAACRHAVAHASNSAAAHYYLGLNQGELARTKTLGALRLVNQMEHEFTEARTLDEHFDYAGPDRCLGLLYRDAPSFGSIGSRSKAREHLQRAAELAPEYPENRLNLIETELKWGEREKARRDLTALEEAMPAARSRFTGPAWASSWSDWEPRFRAVKKKIEDPLKKLETPREK